MHPLLDEMHDALHAAGSDGCSDRPKLFVDGRKIDLSGGTGPIRGTAAMLAGTTDKTFAPVAARLDVERLILADFRGRDLTALAACTRLTHLLITSATGLSDLSPLLRLTGLTFLEITDAPKVQDLTPLSSLTNLRALIFRGGIWNKNRAETLAPLATLSNLEVLLLHNLAVTSDGLRPLAALKNLSALFLSNQFDTADYAYLAVHLPDTDCAEFQAYTRLARAKGEDDIMVTGRHKPFLKSWSPEDQERLAKYEQAFEALKEKFRKESL